MKVISSGKKHITIRLDNDNLVICQFRRYPDKIGIKGWNLALYDTYGMVGNSLDFKSKLDLKKHLKAVYNYF